MYVLQRDDGLYVAKAGSVSSYTKKLEEARVYGTEAAAEKDRCGNESIRSLASIMGTRP